MAPLNEYPIRPAVIVTEPNSSDAVVYLRSSEPGQAKTKEEKAPDTIQILQQTSGMVVRKPRVDHFTALPPEMRLEIYNWVLPIRSAFNSVDLKTFSVPSLCHVSRLMRHEMLPLVEETKFQVNIDSNLVDRYRKRNQLRLTTTWDSSLRQCGLLRLKRKKTALFKALGNYALFRDVTINIFSTERGFVNRKVTKADEIVSSLHLHVTNGELNIEVITGEYHPDNTARFTQGFNGGFEKIDADATVDAIREVAEEIGERDGLKGLTLEDLIKIVKPARHETEPTK